MHNFWICRVWEICILHSQKLLDKYRKLEMFLDSNYSGDLMSSASEQALASVQLQPDD